MDGEKAIVTAKMRLPRRVSTLSCVFFLCLLGKIDAVIYSGTKGSNSGGGHPAPKFTIQKASLTQKGYIQFLQYTSKVPTLTDYTFCVWVRSNNLTYNHPLLSYSKHEEDRLIRVWISEKGENICLEILDHYVFKVAVNVKENIWYHVCQSWSADQGAWDLYLNGKLRSSGFVPKLRGVAIEGGGDIVVGQEYTDFDRGLDDGIEGDVFGFNFVLSSTSGRHPSNPIKLASHPLRRHADSTGLNPLPHPQLPGIHQPLAVNPWVGSGLIGVDKGLNTGEIFPGGSTRFLRTRTTRSIYKDMVDLFDAELRTGRLPGTGYKFYTKIPVQNLVSTGRRVANQIAYDGPKSLGLVLVELGFNCGFRKGAPLSGKDVLVSWTKTPVRVFGGAILKQVPPFCRTV